MTRPNVNTLPRGRVTLTIYDPTPKLHLFMYFSTFRTLKTFHQLIFPTFLHRESSGSRVGTLQMGFIQRVPWSNRGPGQRRILLLLGRKSIIRTYHVSIGNLLKRVRSIISNLNRNFTFMTAGPHSVSVPCRGAELDLKWKGDENYANMRERAAPIFHRFWGQRNHYQELRASLSSAINANNNSFRDDYGNFIVLIFFLVSAKIGMGVSPIEPNLHSSAQASWNILDRYSHLL